MRLGLDIGTNSIGWWLFDCDSEGIQQSIDGGARIFSDGRTAKSKAPLAAKRREARSQRRRRDRYLRRRKALLKRLVEAGLMPNNAQDAKALELLDPYALRAQGLGDKLPLAHFGRALFHLNQRRGFKSNRKTDGGDNESGKIKDATRRLDQAMQAAGARTYGEFLHLRRQQASDPSHLPSVRTRLTTAQREGEDKAQPGYDYYPDRRHLEAEFEALWAEQRKHYPGVLTEDLKEQLFKTIFFQRPLKTPEVGLCLFSGHHGVPSDERRLPKAHPLTQRRVLYETVNALRIKIEGEGRRALSLEERDKIIFALDNKAPTKALSGMKIKLGALASKVLKLPEGQSFTLQTANRDAIACDPVRASLGHPDRMGQHWDKLSYDEQWRLIKGIRGLESEADFDAKVQELMAEFGLDRARAEATANAPLPDYYSNLGETASRRILEALEADVRTYSDAVAACGWHHSDHRSGEVLDALPYYAKVLERHVMPGTGDPKHDEIKRYGRVTNPTVHIGMNQLRRLVNKIIQVYGKPDEIVVELARELKSSNEKKREYEQQNRKNREAAERRSQKLIELGQKDTGANRMLLRLYEDLGNAVGPRCCPYTGKTISVEMLFNGACDIDHILPYSRTLDDSFANRTLCLREANREKRNRSPWEAWGDTDRWPTIVANLKNLPDYKAWRFDPDAMQRLEDRGGFQDRALVDTQYLSRLARQYLDTLYTEGGHVWVVPGRMTEMLRRHWGLNSLLPDRDEGAQQKKNRCDHRHHAIDAAVIAATDRALLNRIAKAAGRDEEGVGDAQEVARSTPPPWDGFRSDLNARLSSMVVSHRADHGTIDRQARLKGKDTTAAQLHDDTALGLSRLPGEHDIVVKRIPLESVDAKMLVDDGRGRMVRDAQLRQLLARATAGKDGKDFAQALADFSASSTLASGKMNPFFGLRHVRVIETLTFASRIEIQRNDGRVYKAYKGNSNHCLEIWRLPDGEIAPLVVSSYQAHTQAMLRPHPAAKRLLRLHQSDMVALEHEGHRVICIVQKFDVNHNLCFSPHNEANADNRDRDKSSTFNFIRKTAKSAVKANIRRVYVDELGHLVDPGSPF